MENNSKKRKVVIIAITALTLLILTLVIMLILSKKNENEISNDTTSNIDVITSTNVLTTTAQEVTTTTKKSITTGLNVKWLNSTEVTLDRGTLTFMIDNGALYRHGNNSSKIKITELENRVKYITEFPWTFDGMPIAVLTTDEKLYILFYKDIDSSPLLFRVATNMGITDFGVLNNQFVVRTGNGKIYKVICNFDEAELLFLLGCVVNRNMV